MKRRDLFSVGGLAMAGLLWDPELLLWRPPQTFVFLSQRVSIADLVAETYTRVLEERLLAGKADLWSDRAIIRDLAEAHTRLLKGLPQ